MVWPHPRARLAEEHPFAVQSATGAPRSVQEFGAAAEGHQGGRQDPLRDFVGPALLPPPVLPRTPTRETESGCPPLLRAPVVTGVEQRRVVRHARQV